MSKMLTLYLEKIATRNPQFHLLCAYQLWSVQQGGTVFFCFFAWGLTGSEFPGIGVTAAIPSTVPAATLPY